MTVEKRHFGYDELTGAYETFFYDHADGRWGIHRYEDVTQHVDVVKAAYNESGTDWKGDMHHVASIPSTLWPELEKIGVMSRGGKILDKSRLKAWLNERDNQAFRTRPGRI